jgi:hypothetical protein
MASGDSSLLNKWKLATRTQSGRADTFRQFIIFSSAVAFTFALPSFTRISPSQVSSVIDHALHGQLDAIAYVRLGVYTALFVFGLLWGLNGLYELHLLQEWLKPEYFTVRRRNLIHMSSILVGALLGLLFAQTPNFSTLIYVFIFYTLVDLFLWKLRRDEIARLIENSLTTLDRDATSIIDTAPNAQYCRNVLEVFRQGSDLLKEYYLVRNHYARVGTQFAGVVILAASLFTWETLYPGQVPKDFTLDGITIVGYLLFVWCLSISEVVVYIWRRDLDTRLATLGKRLYELGAT